MVLVLDPGLRGTIEQLEGELLVALEHGHEAALDLRPEDLLLAVLLRCLRQRRVLLDGETLEPLARLGGNHGRAVVAEQGARQPALLEALAEAVDEALGVFVAEVPLGVAAQARVVVEHGEQRRVPALAAGREHLALGVVEVAVPQTVYVGDLEEPALARHEAGLGLVASGLAMFAEPVMLHVATHRRVAGKRTSSGCSRASATRLSCTSW